MGLATPPAAPRLIVAIDTPDRGKAESLGAAVAPHCGLLKLGLEFFSAHGPAGVAAINPRALFLDLKVHDIPNTVAGAVRAVLPLRPRMLTVHAGGGATMIEAARREAEGAGADRPLLLAVTVLTSLDAEGLNAVGVAGGVPQQVLRLARLALAAGADGLVCAAAEVGMLRDSLGQGPVLVVPGIRPAGAEAGDQVRAAEPAAAIAAGADWIVVGRPITASRDPAAAAEAIARSIAGL
jgi:orotidine-5'-phosphate decarboxylase